MSCSRLAQVRGCLRSSVACRQPNSVTAAEGLHASYTKASASLTMGRALDKLATERCAVHRNQTCRFSFKQASKDNADVCHDDSDVRSERSCLLRVRMSLESLSCKHFGFQKVSRPHEPGRPARVSTGWEETFLNPRILTGLFKLFC